MGAPLRLRQTRAHSNQNGVACDALNSPLVSKGARNLQPGYDPRVRFLGMKCAWIARFSLAPLLTYAAGPAATQPVAITVHLHDVPAQSALAELSKQAGAPFPLVPPDLLEKSSLPKVTLDLDHQPFWAAMEELSRKTGLEPVVSQEDPYPRFQLGLGSGSFWAEPHVIAGPVVLFANEVERTNTVELGKVKHTFERELTVNLTAFAEPGLRVLFASPDIKVLAAVDEKGQPLTVAPEDPTDAAAENDAESGV